ncbi:MAG: serine protein kinase PrkA [Ignavibacteria bacterium]|jgi:predicted Ser/Thr protein kinase|nr:serine protein kinase PrkA [Ignavibacteria bacterium]MCU7500659.1 serine protein kinase PrkA [Ignavibacteria bacterium]MCU7512815.1 serine protein kinase PrkA [Ignavibacteria bacterium]MCU7521774.1 serine protein kinase PrkA [Ignavibacteria bacterium]MCU7526354.1 serine protein kinase PrkA [Ignavibacteria bacterium]
MAPKSSKDVANILALLDRKLKREEKGAVITFTQFLEKVSAQPDKICRNIFQIFHDLIYYYTSEEEDFNNDPESINYKTINCDRLFVEETDAPFFSDLPLANRLVRLADSYNEGTQQNKIYIFVGPPGSGKSTFLNTLLQRFEEYSHTSDGQNYEVVWRLDSSKLNIPGNSGGVLEIPCPSHDHPILMIPRAYRMEVLEALLPAEQKNKIFNKKEYEWVLKDKPCTICSSIYDALSSRLTSPADIFNMIYARRYYFNRGLGNGISVFNPGDPHPEKFVLSNEAIQKELSNMFRDSNLVQYIYSRYARTNNGIFALMDVKGDNEKRLMDLHGIISEGVHKIEDLEENVKSLFIALMNPEDKEKIKDVNSFHDRIVEINVNYILNYAEEVKTYYHSLGGQIEKHFLPGVLENFAKIIISSRLNPDSDAIREWIEYPRKYERYCDDDLLLLKMSLYSNIIPNWLQDEDRKTFDRNMRRKLFSESEKEGRDGFSGRESINIFNDFYTAYRKMSRNGSGAEKLITMEDVKNFFLKHVERNDIIPDGFIESIIRLYDYNVMEEIKESLFNHNQERVSRDVQNYLFASNYDVGEKQYCPYTNETIEIGEAFYEVIEQHLFKKKVSMESRKNFRMEIASRFTITLQEMVIEDKPITETSIYKELYNIYMNNLRENIFEPFLKFTAYENAIKEYGTDKFRKYDQRVKEDVTFLLKNLTTKFRYTEEGAKQVCIYIISKTAQE